MNNTTTTAPNPTKLTVPPLTIDGVRLSLDKLKAIPTDGGESGSLLPCEVASRSVSLALREAKANLEIQKLERGPDCLAESTSKRIQELHEELEKISATRKLCEIFDNLAPAVQRRNKIAGKANEAVAVLEHMKATAAPMEAEISALRARDVRDESMEIEKLKDEWVWTTRIIQEQTTVNLDSREEYYSEHLQNLIWQDKYHGEPTSEGANARVKEIEQCVEAFEERVKAQLTRPEMARLEVLEASIEEINSPILSATASYNSISAMLDSEERELAESLEVARIRAEGVVEVHQVNLATIAVSFSKTA